MKYFFFLSLILIGMTSTALAQDKDVQAVTSSAEQLRLAMVDGDNAKLEKLKLSNRSYFFRYVLALLVNPLSVCIDV